MDTCRKAGPRRQASSRPGTGKASGEISRRTKTHSEVSGRPVGKAKAHSEVSGRPVGKAKARSQAAGKRSPAAGGQGNEWCPAASRCGGCDLQGIPYQQQLLQKERRLHKLLGRLADQVHPIVGMDHPTHYRCKVNAAFGLDRKGKPVLGRYEKNSHHIVPASSCMIEDGRANEIAGAIFSLLPSFRIRVYDEDSGYGLLRHVQIRRSYATGQYMVTLVCTDPVFPSRQNFIKALRSRFPEIATIILNINDRHTSMVLGGRNIILYGKGYIEDVLCGCTFRISPGSFYQVNPPQTQRLYETALRYAALTGKETVLDAYCGTGTIGLIAAGKAKQVIGVELNADAVRDAVWNARCNKVKNIRFVNQDATGYMEELAAQRQSAGRLPAGAFTDDRESGKSIYPDVLILDPPRSGTTPEFIETAARMAPERIIYISCGPDTLARDLELFRDKGYRTKEAQGFDLFPYTEHVETVCLLTHKG